MRNAPDLPHFLLCSFCASYEMRVGNQITDIQVEPTTWRVSCVSPLRLIYYQARREVEEAKVNADPSHRTLPRHRSQLHRQLSAESLTRAGMRAAWLRYPKDARPFFHPPHPYGPQSDSTTTEKTREGSATRPYIYMQQMRARSMQFRRAFPSG